VFSVDSVALSVFLAGVLSGDLPLDEAADDLAALGVRSVRSAADSGFYDPDGAGLLVSFSAGGSVLVSFQDRPY
jgi:hypothetical protein